MARIPFLNSALLRFGLLAILALTKGSAAPNLPQEPTPVETPSRGLSDGEFNAGSQIKVTSLSPAQVDHLVLLGKMWGLLKYYHPNITAGTRNWDYELFRIIPAVLAAADDTSVRQLFVQWVDQLWIDRGNSTFGQLASGFVSLKPQQSGGPVYLRPDLAWVNDVERLGPDLSVRLQRISQRRPWSDQFYVRLAPMVGNAMFTHESAYRAIKLPDAGFQLLGLFRLWNCVEYWSPYRDLVLENWDQVLREFIPRIALARNSETYQLELFALLAKIGDSHANLVGDSIRVRPPMGEGQLPIFRVLGNQIVIKRPLSALGESATVPQPGDILLAVDGEPVDKLIAAYSPYYPASNETGRLRDIANFIGRGALGPVRLTVQHETATIRCDATRVSPAQTRGLTPWQDVPGPAFRLLSKDIAYLKLSAVEPKEIEEYLAKARETKGWIIDIRNYPSHFVVFDLGNHFVEKPTPFARFTSGDLAQPGTFRFAGTAMLQPVTPYYPGRVIVLVDETTVSQAEYTAMALQATPRGLVVGSTTRGADGNVSEIPLPGGFETRISGIGVFYPDLRPTQQKGLRIDVLAQPTLAGMRAGRDEVLEAAVRQLLPQEPEETIRRIANPNP